MADSLTLSITSAQLGGSADAPATLGKSGSLDPADTERLIAWARAALPALQPRDEEGRPIPPATPPSAEQVVQAVADFLLAYLLAQEFNWRRAEAAAAAAAAAGGPIAVTT